MSLKDSPYAPRIRGLLRILDSESLYSLVATVTRNRIIAKSSVDAIEIILRYTESLDKFFSYKRITIQVLFEYLHKKNFIVRKGESKIELIEKVKNEWKKCVPVRDDHHRIQAASTQKKCVPVRDGHHIIPTDINLSISNFKAVNLNLGTPGVNVNVQVTNDHGGGSSGIRSDVFVVEFCKWFYMMLNRLQPEGADKAGDTFSPDVFMFNCSINIYLDGSQNTEKHALGQQEAYQLLKGVCTAYRLNFVPHLDTGVQAQMSEHGMLLLHCCGTLHQGNSMVGVFEQEFGLVKCLQGSWKIMMTKINLKQAESTKCLPALPKGTVFDVPP